MISPEILEAIQQLVGPVTASQLRAVDFALCADVGLFIPSVGHCEYAISQQHTHPAYSFVIALDPASPVAPKGFKVSRHEFPCSAMSPGIPHEEPLADQFSRYIALMVSAPRFEQLWRTSTHQATPTFQWTPFALPRRCLNWVKQFFKEYEEKNLGHQAIQEALATCLLHEVIRCLHGNTKAPVPVPEQTDIQRVIELMHERFSEKRPVSYWALQAHRSETQFSRVFRQETGRSPAAYLVNLRIEKARKLLAHSDQDISEIAFACGFSSAAHFSETFRRLTGVSPTRFRQSYRA